ncbi:MAG: amidohydrolase family protein [Promethearchaeota archaeon]
MKDKLIKSELGLIGKDLELKKNVEIILDDKGVIKEIYFEDFDDKFKLIPNKKQELIVPGFINAHVHIGDNFVKERGFNKDLIEVVAPPNGIKHRLLSLTPKDVIIEGMKKAGYEMLSNGITCFMDFREQYIKGINLANEALKNVKIRHLLLGRFENNGEIEDIFKISDGIGLSSYNVVNHKNKNLLKILKKKYGKIIACHDAELVRKQEVFEKILEDDFGNVS